MENKTAAQRLRGPLCTTFVRKYFKQIEFKWMLTGTDIFIEIFLEQTNAFINSYTNVSKKIFYNPDNKNKLHHAGEFGIYRENLVKNFLKLFVPQKFNIEGGFIISPNSKPSKQLDLIIYDKNEAPLIETERGQKFFPIESVVSVGEIKSNLTKTQFKNELLNLVEIKKIREKIGPRIRMYSRNPKQIKGNIATDFPFDPIKYYTDQISTFIICNKLDFKFSPDNIDNDIGKLYPNEIHERHKVDFILSIEDGYIGYYNKEEKIFKEYNNFQDGNSILEILLTNTDDLRHVKQFITLIANRITFTSILKTEMYYYLKKL